MTNAHDVAAYILTQKGQMVTSRLHSLLYYSQAWHLTWEDKPLFPEKIEAWAGQPVIPKIYEKYRKGYGDDLKNVMYEPSSFKMTHRYIIMKEWPWGKPQKLNENERESILLVLQAYQYFDYSELTFMARNEMPYQMARKGLQPDEPSHNIIEKLDMTWYYGSQMTNPYALPVLTNYASRPGKLPEKYCVLPPEPKPSLH